MPVWSTGLAGNAQPYLQDFQGSGPVWVITMKPRGNTDDRHVMFTDAVDGTTKLWRACFGHAAWTSVA